MPRAESAPSLPKPASMNGSTSAPTPPQMATSHWPARIDARPFGDGGGARRAGERDRDRRARGAEPPRQRRGDRRRRHDVRIELRRQRRGAGAERARVEGVAAAGRPRQRDHRRKRLTGPIPRPETRRCARPARRCAPASRLRRRRGRAASSVGRGGQPAGQRRSRDRRHDRRRKAGHVEARHRRRSRSRPPPARRATTASRLRAASPRRPRARTPAAALVSPPLPSPSPPCRHGSSVEPYSQTLSTSRRRSMSFGCLTSANANVSSASAASCPSTCAVPFTCPPSSLTRERGRLELDLVARSHQAAELRALDADQERVQIVAPAQAHRRLAQHAAELRQRFERQRARHHRVAGKVVGEDVVGQRDALDAAGARGRLQRRDAVEEDVAHAAGTLSPCSWYVSTVVNVVVVGRSRHGVHDLRPAVRPS